MKWTEQQWRDYADPELETWVAYVSGTPAGYFELELQPGANVEIPRFGSISAAALTAADHLETA